MLCKLCTKFYLEEESFVNLFNFDSICEICKEKYKPLINFEIIPIYQGEIYYYYLYENIQINLNQEKYLEIYLDKLYSKILSKDNNFDLIIYLDDYIFQNLNELKLISRGFIKIFMFSLKRIALEYEVIF